MIISTGFTEVIAQNLVQLGNVVVLMGLTIVALKRGYPLYQWLLLLSTSHFFARIGSSVFTWIHHGGPASESLFQSIFASGQNILGWLFGAMLGIWIFAKWTKTPLVLWDELAWLWPIGLAIARVSCLIQGCCHGTLCPLPTIAIQYGPQHTPFQYHVHQGWISSHSSLSLPIWPLQFMEMILLIAMSVVLYLAIKRFHWLKGRATLVSFSLYAILRFALEFIRADGSYFGPLKELQWGLLMAILVLSFLIVRFKAHTHSIPILVSYKRAFALILMLTSLQVCLSPYQNMRQIVMVVLLVSTGLAMSYQLWTVHRKYFAFMWVSLSVLFVSLAMSPQESTKAPMDPSIRMRFGTFAEEGTYPGSCQKYQASFYGLNSEVSIPLNSHLYLKTSAGYMLSNYNQNDFGEDPIPDWLGSFGLGLESKYAGIDFQNYWNKKTLNPFNPNDPLFAIIPSYVYIGNRNYAWLEGRIRKYAPGSTSADAGIAFSLGSAKDWQNRSSISLGASTHMGYVHFEGKFEAIELGLHLNFPVMMARAEIIYPLKF